MSPEALGRHTFDLAAVRESFLRYSAVLRAQTERNTLQPRHDVEPRLARWLLMPSDRVGRSDFPLPQDFLTSMLGVRRATVSEDAEAL